MHVSVTGMVLTDRRQVPEEGTVSSGTSTFDRVVCFRPLNYGVLFRKCSLSVLRTPFGVVRTGDSSVTIPDKTCQGVSEVPLTRR